MFMHSLSLNFGFHISIIIAIVYYIKQDACTDVHSACRREENGQKSGGGAFDLQIWDLNRVHETERTVFPMPQVFSMCRRTL